MRNHFASNNIPGLKFQRPFSKTKQNLKGTKKRLFIYYKKCQSEKLHQREFVVGTLLFFSETKNLPVTGIKIQNKNINHLRRDVNNGDRKI